MPQNYTLLSLVWVWVLQKCTCKLINGKRHENEKNLIHIENISKTRIVHFMDIKLVLVYTALSSSSAELHLFEMRLLWR